MAGAALVATVVALCAGPARAEYVDLELVLAVDTSSSVSYDEYALQMVGFAEAFRNPLLHRALEAAGEGGIAVAVLQWASADRQDVAVDWHTIDDAASAGAFADILETTPRLIDNGGTSISGAIDFASAMFALNDYEGRRRTVDISGDGRNNHGRWGFAARDEAIARGITINGLAILNEEPNVDQHYAKYVIGGPGAFLMTADDYMDFADAILLKLVREISGDIVARAPSGGAEDAAAAKDPNLSGVETVAPVDHVERRVPPAEASMFIQTEATADPAAIKFLPGRAVLGEGSVEYRDAGEAGASPLAERLFAIPTVTRVAFGADFVTVTKDDTTDWQVLKPAVLGVIMEHFVAGRPVMAGPGGTSDALTVAVRDLVDGRIRPAVEGARGTIALRDFVAGTATIELGGAPASNPTFRNGIENMLRHYVPEVERVRFVAPAADPAREAAAQESGLGTLTAQAIQTLLDDEINPSVAAHGGHVALVDVKDKRAYVRLEGGCQGCGMADVTLKHGIEMAILEKYPDIEEVLDVTDHADGTNPYYQPSKGGESPWA